MRRTLLGWLVLLHAVSHAAMGMWAMDVRNAWVVAILWVIAILGYGGAGLGLLRFPMLRDRWVPLLTTAGGASVVLAILSPTIYATIGVAITVALVTVALGRGYSRTQADIVIVDVLGRDVIAHPRWTRAGWVFGALAVVYAAGVVIMRPIFLVWGTTHDERVASLPGDEVLTTGARYRVDHAITIHAPADSVWAWLVQLGQDRGGFYSYDWLERAAGLAIRNTDSIHAKWQTRAVGDTVFATQPEYFGGALGNLGWRVSAVVPGRAMVLENWGAFVVNPADAHTTRLIVRTRGDGRPSTLGLVLAPMNVFVFEPMHFIMQRGMLRGIRDRAERSLSHAPLADAAPTRY